MDFFDQQDSPTLPRECGPVAQRTTKNLVIGHVVFDNVAGKMTARMPPIGVQDATDGVFISIMELSSSQRRDWIEIPRPATLGSALSAVRWKLDPGKVWAGYAVSETAETLFAEDTPLDDGHLLRVAQASRNFVWVDFPDALTVGAALTNPELAELESLEGSVFCSRTLMKVATRAISGMCDDAAVIFASRAAGRAARGYPSFSAVLSRSDAMLCRSFEDAAFSVIPECDSYLHEALLRMWWRRRAAISTALVRCIEDAREGGIRASTLVSGTTLTATLSMPVSPEPSTWIPESAAVRRLLVMIREMVVSPRSKVCELVDAYRFDHSIGFDASIMRRMAEQASMLSIQRGLPPSAMFYAQCDRALLLRRQARHLLHMVKQPALGEWVCISVDGIYVHRTDPVVTNYTPAARRDVCIIDDAGMGRKTVICAYARMCTVPVTTQTPKGSGCEWADRVRAAEICSSAAVADGRAPGKILADRVPPPAFHSLMMGGMLIVTASVSQWAAEMDRMGVAAVEYSRIRFPESGIFDTSVLLLEKSRVVIVSKEAYDADLHVFRGVHWREAVSDGMGNLALSSRLAVSIADVPHDLASLEARFRDAGMADIEMKMTSRNGIPPAARMRILSLFKREPTAELAGNVRRRKRSVEEIA